MRVKRTYAATMREALAQVKQEQGADAIILGNKKVPGGVEILSTVDFDHRNMDAYAAQPEMTNVHEQVAGVNTSKVNLNAVSVPDFALNQNSEGRQEPVLGLLNSEPTTRSNQSSHGEVKSSVSQLAAQPEVKIKKTSLTVSQSKNQQKPTLRKNNKAKQVASPVKVKAAATAQKKSLPVEDEVEERQSQSSLLLSSLRDNAYTMNQPLPVHNQPMIDEVKDELKNLRDLMQSQLNVLEWDRYNERHPVRSVLLNLMAEMGLGTDVCEIIFKQLGPLTEDPHKVWQKALGFLAKEILIAKTEILTNGGRVALVGSTGVGKTTTIAKLAARFAHAHGKRSVALITTDNFRIGAQEQLQHFARMLEIPLLTANGGEELSDRLKMLEDKALVLIDTAGMSQTDVRLSEQFHSLQHGSPEIQPYLVLSANTQLAALNETIASFKKVKLAGGIVTKIDESSSLGGILTTSIRHQLPLTYCGTGQKVPEDLSVAKNHRLVSKAVSLMQRYADQVDKETLAFRYNHLISQ